MPVERKTKNEARAHAREIAALGREKRRKQEQRKRILIRSAVTVAVLAVLAGIGAVAWASTRPEAPGPANMLSGGVVFTGSGGETQVVETSSMPAGGPAVPTDASKFPAPAQIVTYLDFGCEYCKAFENANGQQIGDMVGAGRATLEVQPVAITGDYAVRAGSAASCMAAYQPESFFDMLTAMYENQPAEGGPGLTSREILDMWRNAGITASSELSSCVTDARYAEWIKARTESVVADPAIVNPATGSFGTPTIFVNGKRYEPSNLSDPAEFAAFVEANSDSAAGVAPGS